MTVSQVMSESDTVILAATPPGDHCISMDLVAREVHAALEKAAPEVGFTLIRPGGEHRSWLGKQSLRYWHYPRLLRRTMRAHSQSVLHVLDHSYAHLCRTSPRAVVTCYDLANFAVTGLNPIQMGLWKTRVRGLHHAVRIIAISENTARDIHEALGIPRDRIVVSHLGVAKEFCPVPSSQRRLGDAAKLLSQSPGSFFFLHVGSNERRKNIPVLLKAFARAKQRSASASLRLVKVGRKFTDDGLEPLLSDLNIAGDVIELGRISDEALIEIYNYVDCLVFPSLYEGFGLPVAEAQACGLPCILANASCLKEVGGAAALYHESEDPEDLANQMVELVTNQSLRARLSELGLQNAMRFRWDVHARALLDVYGEVLDITGARRTANLQNRR
jgi:glycosyltransferase involved in cell wall biosynthesis